ncbi:MAG: hypothetical protein WAQ08_10910 [Aquabacterium sp.]
MRNIYSLVRFLVLVLLSVGFSASAWAIALLERQVQCLPTGYTAPAASTFHPSAVFVNINQDAKSRYVVYAVGWNSSNGGVGLLASNGLGMEFKTIHYNHPQAAARGKGPAYVYTHGSYFYSELPGSYADTDFASDFDPATGEYNEPQVSFGMAPGAAVAVQLDRAYVSWARAVSGRGDKSLLKVHQNATKLVQSGIGTSGYFLCNDVPMSVIVSFQDGVYSPTCVRKNGSNPLQGCAAPQTCTETTFRGNGNVDTMFTHYPGDISGDILYVFDAALEPNDLTLTNYASLTPRIKLIGFSGTQSGGFNNQARDGRLIGVVRGFVSYDAWSLILGCPDQPLKKKTASASETPPAQATLFSYTGYTQSGSSTLSISFTFRNDAAVPVVITGRSLIGGEGNTQIPSITGGTCAVGASLGAGASCSVIVSAAKDCLSYKVGAALSNAAGTRSSALFTVGTNGQVCN